MPISTSSPILALNLTVQLSWQNPCLVILPENRGLLFLATSLSRTRRYAEPRDKGPVSFLLLTRSVVYSNKGPVSLFRNKQAPHELNSEFARGRYATRARICFKVCRGPVSLIWSRKAPELNSEFSCSKRKTYSYTSTFRTLTRKLIVNEILDLIKD